VARAKLGPSASGNRAVRRCAGRPANKTGLAGDGRQAAGIMLLAWFKLAAAPRQRQLKIRENSRNY